MLLIQVYLKEARITFQYSAGFRMLDEMPK